ncbi:hypothetical protein [Frigoriflavimonas asaccharolytica]|uniref:hypothetical protein n=1 Tax=Frigoriflavimonas asaccharolytica TaxID=2735899 RepID=UPI003612FC16
MKIRILFILFLYINLFSAQNVVFNKIESTFKNKDQFLYKIDNGNQDAKFLAEIEIQGYSSNYVETFKKILSKAKEVGANAFAYQPFLKIDENDTKINVSNYKLNLYHLDKALFHTQENEVILIASSAQDQKIRWNDENILLKENSFLRLDMLPGEIYSLSTRGLFGSTVKLSYNQNQKKQYFLISSLKVKSDKSGVGGLNLKTGDIISVDSSYGDFLTIILQELEIQKSN